MKGLRRFFFYLMPYRKNLVGFTSLTIFSIILGVFSITLVIPFLQIIFDEAVLPTVKPGFNYSVKSIMDNLYYYAGNAMGGTSKKGLLLLLCMATVVLFFLKNLL